MVEINSSEELDDAVVGLGVDDEVGACKEGGLVVLADERGRVYPA